MRPSLRLAVAGIAVAAMTLGVAAPAGAQESLGFEINITEGGPGEIVAGQVNTDDVAEFCTTDLEEFQQLFLERFELVLEIVFGEPFFPGDPTSFEELGLVLMGIIVLGALFDPELGADVLAQTFVMTFADIATQEPVGEMGNFDPDTGQGTVVVPDIDPGFWAVAAACVSPTTDEETILAMVAAAGATAEGIDFSGFGFSEPFPTIDELLGAALGGDEDFLALLEEVGPTLLAPWMVPDAFGAVIFCILDAEGVCPDGEVPGDDDDDDGEAPEPARPVLVQPVFTG